jgi:FKBP-type peptidyl-prolyl cis-trans isomerase FklB
MFETSHGSPPPIFLKGITMKTTALAILSFLLAFGITAAQSKNRLNTDQKKMSYSIGMNIGKNLTRQNLELHTSSLFLGLRHGLSGKNALLSDREIREVMAAFQKTMRGKAQALKKNKGDKNKTEGAAFLASNKKISGVKTTKSGLQYKLLKPGKGTSPTPTDTVEVHYKGTLLDGKEFDSSYKRGKPAMFQVNRVIKGWTEALQMLKPGGQMMVWIPSNLAYGERGAGLMIGPHATLIFDIKLISVK